MTLRLRAMPLIALNWPGCCSAGDTEEEALENAKEAIALYLEPAQTASCLSASNGMCLRTFAFRCG